MGSYLAEISLAALAIAVVVAIVRNVNVGPLSLAIALVVGHYMGGVKIKAIIAGYPVNVFHHVGRYHILVCHCKHQRHAGEADEICG